MNYYLKVLKNYSVFTGRARRSEYWYFVLFNSIFTCVAMGIDNILRTTIKINSIDLPMGYIKLPYGYVYLLYTLVIFLPALAVTVRRLHDVGKSGWFLIIAFIPLVGAIWLIVLYCTEGTQGPNQFGEDPKAAAPETV